MMRYIAFVSICLCLCVSVFAATAGPTTATRPVAAVDQTTPIGAMKVFATAMQQGDGAKLSAVLLAENPAEEKIADGIAQTAVAARALQRIASAKFGEKAARSLPAGLPTAADISSLDSATERLAGDRASVDAADASPRFATMNLKRLDGRWRILVGDMIPAQPADLREKTMLMVRGMTQAMKEVADDLTADKYKSAEDARLALEAKTKAAIAIAMLPVEPPSTRPASGPATRP